jgi:hypothetical protein
MADDEIGIILELYKTAVEMADRMSARRSGANSFFLTLNTALAAIVGIVSSARKTSPRTTVPAFDSFGLCVTAAAGIVFAVVWWALLRYYRRLSGAKFDVINKIEIRLPVRPYTDEWAILHPQEPFTDATGTGGPRRRRKKHREATVVEQYVPFVFVALYVVLAIRTAVQ